VSTVFHLIRHAAHGQLGKILTGRMPGVGLSEEGRAQAQALARAMMGWPLDAIRTSPQQRTAETAEILAKNRSIRPEVLDPIDEIDFGRWAGRSFAELEDDAEWRVWNVNRGAASTPGGETMQNVAARFAAAIDELRREFPRGFVALVSHCDVIKAGFCHYLNLPFDRIDRFEIAPASVSTLVVGDWGSKVLALNRVHAPGAPA
jgi:broad specificity phosphatase PhoE